MPYKVTASWTETDGDDQPIHIASIAGEGDTLELEATILDFIADRIASGSVTSVSIAQLFGRTSEGIDLTDSRVLVTIVEKQVRKAR